MNTSNITDKKEYSKKAKAVAMRQYRERLKEGKVRGSVNFTKDSVVCVQTQIKEKIILDMRETLEELNEDYKTDYTSSQLLSAVLDTALQALKMKEKILENGQKTIEFYLDHHILQHNNLLEFNPELTKASNTKNKPIKI